MKTKRILFVILLMVAVWGWLHSQDAGAYESEEHRFRVEMVAGGLRNPWSIAILPDNDFLISERGGRLWRISARTGEKAEVDGLPPVVAVGQGGLLDVEVSSDFLTTNLLFFSHSTKTSGGGYATAISRAVLRQNSLSDVRTIFVANNPHTSGIHFGSRIAEMADGTLLFSVGDRGRRDDAQNPALHAGSVLRIDKNGAPPADNPFVGQSGYAPEMYSTGHRNIQGLAIAYGTFVLAHEHGPMGGDEVNRIIGGKNYGWPHVTFGQEYRTRQKIGTGTSAAGYEAPLFQWTPSIAPSGMLIYSGKRFPRWSGNIFVGALAGQHVARLTYMSNTIIREEKLLEDDFGRIRDLKEDKNGIIYFITDARSGGLYRITP